MNNYFKVFKKCKSSTGFTLIELLVAVSLTTLIVSGAGFGIVSIMRANTKAKSQTDRRMELNRAIDFISDEIRQSRAINRVSAPVASKPSTTTIEAGTEQSILILELPNAPQPVVYYIAQPKNSSVWLGPRVIYRWGPNLAGNGTYTDFNDDSKWKIYPLVDLIEDSKPNPNPLCKTGWSPKPSAPDRKGFYVCVDRNYRVADIRLLGRLTKAYNISTEPYEVSSKVFSRPYDVVLGAGGSDLFNVPNGEFIPSKSLTVNLKVIGSSITCGPGGPPITVKTRILVNGNVQGTADLDVGQSISLSANTVDKVTVRGTAFTKSCIGKDTTYVSSNTNQVFALRNGDPVPDFKPFDNQTTVKKYLEEYTDPVTKKISIANNEVIYLFELGVTDKNSSAFDSQDLVVLATAEPK